MKVLVVLSALLATSLAKPGYLSSPDLLARALGAPTATLVAAAPAPAPAIIRTVPAANIVIGPEGVPLETPEVAAAKASHAAAVGDATARDAATNAAAAAAAAAAAPAAERTAPAVPAAPVEPANIVIGPEGVPLDTPEVAAARASHAAAVAETSARGVIVNSAPFPAVITAPAIAAPAIATAPALFAARTFAGPAIAAAPAIAAGATIIDARTPAATALAAHAIAAPAIAAPAIAAPAIATHTIAAPGIVGPNIVAARGLITPAANIVIGADGVPLDTPEVAAARAADTIAHLEAKARLGLLG